MPSPVNSRSLCRWLISLGTALFAAGGSGCSDDASCGVGTGTIDHFVVTDGAHVLTFTELTSLAANDCPDSMAPDAPTSVTIEGHQVGGPGLITLCIPRPDRLGEGSQTFGTRIAGGGDVLIEDLFGSVDGCSISLDSAAAPSATALAKGVCDNATNPAGFELVASGGLTGKRTCGSAPQEATALTLDADVAITLRP